MGSSWWFRIWLILLTTLGAVYTLLPSFLDDGAQERLSAQAEQVDGGAVSEETSGQVTGWESWLPDTRINLGLDLQGGIDLTLDVEVDEAVLSSVARDIQSVMARAEEELRREAQP